MFLKISAFILTSVFTFSVLADLEQDYNAIKNSGRSFEPQGTICEEVAKLGFEKQFPAPQFEVITGITYGEKFGTLGELDLIVIDTVSNTAVAIGEVKCWKNPAQGLAKAMDQRDRFIRNIHSGKNLVFGWDQDQTRKFSKDQFSKINTFVSIAQKGSKEVGFDQELDYTLKELMTLRSKILRCQDLADCKKPTY